MGKKQTAVEWLSNQTYELFEQYSEGNFDRIQLNKLIVHATNQAKEMEKQQIIDAAERWKGTDFAEKYYAETYGSKGSDERKKNLDFLVEQAQKMGLYDTSSQTEISDEQAIEMVKDMNKQPMRFHCVPKEISDEEILDAAARCKFNADVDISIGSFELGAKWYREQLKKK